MEPHFGWLEKKSGGKEEQEASKKKSMGQRRGKWDKRYFVVVPAGDNKGQMMYFKDDSDWQKYAKHRICPLPFATPRAVARSAGTTCLPFAMPWCPHRALLSTRASAEASSLRA